jgi:hypothetical protein
MEHCSCHIGWSRRWSGSTSESIRQGIRRQSISTHARQIDGFLNNILNISSTEGRIQDTGTWKKEILGSDRIDGFYASMTSLIRMMIATILISCNRAGRLQDYTFLDGVQLMFGVAIVFRQFIRIGPCPHGR